jgi:hypothetical protein
LSSTSSSNGLTFLLTLLTSIVGAVTRSAIL